MAGFSTYEAGDIEATATIDRAAFQETLDSMKEDVEDFISHVYTVRFDASDDPAQATIDDMRASVDELTDRDWELLFGADTADAEAKFDFMHAQIDDLELPVDVPIHVSDDLAMAKLAALQLELDQVKKDAVEANLELRVKSLGLEGALNEIKELDQKLGSGGGKGAGGGSSGGGISPFGLGGAASGLWSALSGWTAFVMALPTVVGVVQGLSVAVGGLVTMFSIAGVGTLAFAGIAVPAIEKVMSAISAGTKLTGPLGQLETAIKALEKGWAQLEKVADPSVFSALTYSIDQIDQILPSLAPLFVEAGQGFRAFMTPIFQGMQGSGFTSFVSWLSSEATPVAHSFGVAIQGVAQAWAGWMGAFGPALPGLEKGLDGVAKDWAAFADGLQGKQEGPYFIFNQSWLTFLSNGLKDLHQMRILLGNVGNAIGQLFVSVGPSGPTALSALNKGLEAIGKILTPLLGPLATLGSGLLTDLADFLSGLSGGGTTGAKNLGKVITELGDEAKKSGPAFERLGRDVGKLVGYVSEALTVLPGFFNWLTNGPMTASKNFHTWMLSSSDDVNKWVQTVPGDFANAWGAITRTASKAPGNIAAWFKSLPGDIWSWIETIPGDFGKTWDDIISGVEKWWTSTAKPWFAALPGNIVGAIGDAGTLLFNIGVDIIKGLWKGVTSVASWLQKNIAGLAGDVAGWFAHVIGANSPSTVFRALGLNIGQGLAQGITAGSGLAVAATAQMATSVVNSGFGGTVGARTVGVQMANAPGAPKAGNESVVNAIQELGKKIDDLPRKYQLILRTR